MTDKIFWENKHWNRDKDIAIFATKIFATKFAQKIQMERILKKINIKTVISI